VSSIAISGVVFACVFGGGLVGIFLRTALPERYLNADTKEVVKLAIGLIATMSALVLGLLINSAKSSYDTHRIGLARMSANIGLLDRILSHYGPESQEARNGLRQSVVRILEQTWPTNGSQTVQLEPTITGGEALYDQIQALSPRNEAQRVLQAKALSIAFDIGQTRWLMFQQTGGSVPIPFLAILAFWLTVLFLSFSLFAPPNATLVTTLLAGALSVSGAIFLILQLDRPFEGLIQISSDPLRSALAHLGQ
jgi:hypothetical protein